MHLDLKHRDTSASEVVREALRLMEDRDNARSSQLGGFQRRAFPIVLLLSNRGHFVKPEDVFARLKKKSAARRASGK
jgi:Arc/MetJ-type ribon-helix-helix transcriptional regulator